MIVHNKVSLADMITSFHLISKFKVSRGGGRHFSRDVTDTRRVLKDGEEESSEEESSEEESSEEEEEETGPAPALSKEMAALNLKLGNTESVAGPEDDGMTRAERKAAKKAQAEGKAAKKVQIKDESDSEESEDDELLNPKKAADKRQAEKAQAKAELSRKERSVERSRTWSDS